MNRALNAFFICILLFCSSKLQAMSYMTIMNEQDLPITGAPQTYREIYIQPYDDFAHIQPIRCKKECTYKKEREAQQTALFKQDE